MGVTAVSSVFMMGAGRIVVAMFGKGDEWRFVTLANVTCPNAKKLSVSDHEDRQQGEQSFGETAHAGAER